MIAAVVPLAAARFPAATRRAEPAEPAARRRQADRHPLQRLAGAAHPADRPVRAGIAFTEGAGNDWLGVAVIDGYGAAAGGRPADLRRLPGRDDRRTLVRADADRPVRPGARSSARRPWSPWSACCCSCSARCCPVAFVGALLWGLGAALGFPVGMSAAADDPAMAAARVSVVASIGYTAFLAGPPLIGFLGDHVGVLRALTVVAGLLAAGRR